MNKSFGRGFLSLFLTEINIRVIKYTCFMLILFIFQSAAYSYVQSIRIDLNIKQSTLKQVFKEIESKTDYTFFYNDELIDLERIVDVQAKKETVESILNKVLTNSTFRIENKNILLIPKSSDSSPSLMQQTKRQITGMVKDEQGEPIIGANVMEKGTTNGVVTNIDGHFSMLMEKNTRLQISYVGYITQEISINNQTSFHIILKEDSRNLEEVVVVGYGTQKKVNLTGSIATVSDSEILTSTNSNLANMLTGKLSGVRVQQKTSEPGEYSMNFDIRGMGSPLVVIDGVPRDNFQRLDPNEIENITILKDASAAIYGVRASNGVVLITTKKGEKGKINIDFTGTYGWQILSTWPHPLNGYDFANLQNENALNNGQPLAVGRDNSVVFAPEIVEKYRIGSPDVVNTNWEDLVMRNAAPLQQYNLKVSGGSEKVKYFTSLGYTQDDGLWKGNSLTYNRFNVRSNISANINERFSFELLVSGIYDKKEAPLKGQWEIFKSIWMQRPDLPVYANNTYPYYQNVADNIHPSIITDREISGYNDRETRIFQGTASASYLVPGIEGLKARIQYSYDFQQNYTKNWKKKYSSYNYDIAADSYIPAIANNPSRKTNYYNQWVTTNLQAALEYERSFEKVHNVKGLVLFEQYIKSADNFYGHRDVLLDEVDQLVAGIDANKNANSDMANIYNIANQGFVGRLNYDYSGKYLAEFSFRYDGSSKFAKGHQWGFFPAGSIGWRISEEYFFKERLPFINNLKFRASYGVMGDDSASNYQYLTGYTYPQGNYFFNGSSIPGLGFRSMANTELTWYTSKIFNAGFDASLWNGRLGMSLDLFNRNRTGLLATRVLSLPGTLGSDLPQENLNQDYTRGFEIALSHDNKINDFWYNISGNFSFTRIKYGYQEEARQGNSYLNWRYAKTNRYTDTQWGYAINGQFTNYEAIFAAPNQDGQGGLLQHPGDFQYIDWNGDGVIDGLDHKIIGRGTKPLINFGMTIAAAWKNFDINILLQGAAFSNVKRGEQFTRPLRWERNGLDIFADRWQRADPYDRDSEEWISGKYPTTKGGQNYSDSEFMIENSSYLRLKSLEIGYSMPTHIIKKANIEKVRFFVNGFNLLTWSGLDYVDPERTTDQYGYMYPIMRNINVGINITF